MAARVVVVTLHVLLKTPEVAELCRVSEPTVRWWRHVRTGPPFFKINGAVRYRRSDVEAWLAQQYEATAVGDPIDTAKGIA